MNKSTIIIIVVVVIIAIGAYFYFEGGAPATNSGLIQVQAGDPEASAVSSQILSLLNQIKSLSIDSSLFTDPAFKTLMEYPVTIPTVNVGRNNPFAPLPGEPLNLPANGTSH